MKSWARSTFDIALQRLDVLMHREIFRLRVCYQLSQDEFRGLYVSDEQVDELIRQHINVEQLDVIELSAKAEKLRLPARKNLSEDSRWSCLCESYHLSDFEQEVLFLAFVAEFHSKYPVLFAYLNNDITRKYPSIELALNLFSETGGDRERMAFSSQSTLIINGLLVMVDQESSRYTLQSGFVIAPTLREYLLGHNAIDEKIIDVCYLKAENFQPWQHYPFLSDVTNQFEALSTSIKRSSDTPYFVIEAEKGSGALVLAENSLFSAGLSSCRINLKRLLVDKNMLNHAIRSICQTALLEHAGLIINDFADILEAQNYDKSLVDFFFHQLAGTSIPIFLVVELKCRWRELLAEYQYVNYSIKQAQADERYAYWHYHLQRFNLSANQNDLSSLADYFQLNYEQVQVAVSNLAFGRGQLDDNRQIPKDELFAVARLQSYGEIGDLAEKVEKEYTLKDLILPGSTLSRVNEVISAIKSRHMVFEQWDFKRRLGSATGIVSLFAGASGTGKTMTASVIANEIGLDLYRIELSGIVSKYIGETEKNLDKIFKAAKQANCILFFDEADALFGKRSEVKDAHDRYANIEVSYLLQKIESHDGIVILTTNLAKSIDQAFTRRMQFIIEYPRPDVEHREKLWSGMFGKTVPLADDVDFNFLARQLDNTGGDIKNMALDAALMAASSERQVIDMALLVRAAARQMMKQGKVPSAIEFKHYFRLVDNNIA